MHPHVVQACEALHRSIARTSGFSQWLTDQAEEALTELVNNPHRSDPASHLIRNARSNASKKLKLLSGLEAKFLQTLPCGKGGDVNSILTFGCDRAVNHSIAEHALDIEAVMARLSPAERQLIELAADGQEAEEIALQLGVSAQRVREQLSRARLHARELWAGAPS